MGGDYQHIVVDWRRTVVWVVITKTSLLTGEGQWCGGDYQHIVVDWRRTVVWVVITKTSLLTGEGQWCGW